MFGRTATGFGDWHKRLQVVPLGIGEVGVVRLAKSRLDSVRPLQSLNTVERRAFQTRSQGAQRRSRSELRSDGACVLGRLRVPVAVSRELSPVRAPQFGELGGELRFVGCLVRERRFAEARRTLVEGDPPVEVFAAVDRIEAQHCVQRVGELEAVGEVHP